MLSQQINPIVNKVLKLQIKVLQNAPTDAEKLEQLLKANRRQKEEAMDIEDAVTEIEMLMVVLYLAMGKR
jgi:CRISPR/Cas system CSM-associated protein Csm2 small subunit